jgi:lysophospholipase L1-like esterase
LLRKSALVICVAFLSLGAAEIFLRVFHHDVLPVQLSNQVATGYHPGFDGLYDFHPEMHTSFFKPSYRRRMYFNGYRWEHRGDSRGFRNPVERSRVDVALVGDSMVYGHGLEERDTIRHQLEDRLGRPVANLGIQGASAHDEYQIVKNYAIAMDPKYLFLFFLSNDIEDLLLLSEEVTMRFVSAPPEQRDVVYFETRPSTPSWRDRRDDVLEGLYVFRALRILDALVRRELFGVAAADAAPLPPGFARDRRMSLAMLFHETAVRRMYLMARDHGIELVHVFTYTGQPDVGEDFYEEVLGRFCAREGIPFLTLRPALTAALERGEQPFLAGDGHFSRDGARIVAEALADWIHAAELGQGRTVAAKQPE